MTNHICLWPTHTLSLINDDKPHMSVTHTYPISCQWWQAPICLWPTYILSLINDDKPHMSVTHTYSISYQWWQASYVCDPHIPNLVSMMTTPQSIMWCTHTLSVINDDKPPYVCDPHIFYLLSILPSPPPPNDLFHVTYHIHILNPVLNGLFHMKLVCDI